jgi:hypothetical protein
MNDNRFDEKFDERLAKAARRYNEPPETPREAMWARIRAGRADRRVIESAARGGFWWLRRVWIPAVAAAVLVLGIAIGRFTAPVGKGDLARSGPLEAGPRETPGDAAPAGSGGGAYQLAAVPVLNQAELLLTQFRAGDAVEDNGDSYSARATALLMDTRLLLDSPAADNPEMRRLFSDLELVLTQIVRMAGESDPDEREYITDNMKNQSLLPRLRVNIVMGTYTGTI